MLVASLASCGGDRSSRLNIRPPQPGTPARASDVVGIYRTVHQGLLQLRQDGEFVLIVSEGPGPSAGTYTLENGRLTVQTDVCGTAVGEYDVVVGGQPKAGQATLTFTTVRDDCGPRSRYLTIDPWVYANS
ncbi:MAG: hypothetical protein ACRD12_18225 [Acidimicrobiales bacterium]